MWWVVGQGGVVRQDVIRVQVPGGQTHAAQECERVQKKTAHGDGREQDLHLAMISRGTEESADVLVTLSKG